MRYGSVCSGIEAASVAWEPLGWIPAWFSEIEPFPSAVLAHHWPHVKNLGDMTQLAEMVSLGIVEAPDVLVGGTPCQAFSVAGNRQGLADERGALTLAFCELADAIDEARGAGNESIIVWENVPGVLSSRDNAFGCFLGELSGAGCELHPAGKRWSDAGCVFGPQRAIAWRILDAQYFGVAQRRRRVFVVASARAGFDPAAVLFEREGVRRDTAPERGKAAQGIRASIACGGELHGCLTKSASKYHNQANQESRSGLYHIIHDGRPRTATLVELCRLQGFPDTFFSGFEKSYWRCYGALGNSMAVPVMRWIGRRIDTLSGGA